MHGDKKFLSNKDPEMPHVGNMLQAYIDRNRTYQAALARAIDRAPQTLLSYKKNHSIQTAILWELCHALKYNFFADLAAALPDTFGRSDNEALNEKDKEIAALQAEVIHLQKEKDLLVHLIKDK